ncbi:sterol acyltransferase NDAI_0K01630 [Naumovozyma dairenensis CBS 421]|uniref:O-acyltransferase n=1 Tax=Naumovozyma dairenensis (strain ATCC 10597 / BCRC 20456 / CBS 421 / NBRC 0211 / NRRL Y-12639) TaxID=1071378 RepID=G0WHU3_NAUDC|nr:hypothetical protein NDAI_0K01630 [Naumovozyma dairenensis CBS 421]CCD27354.1 hypothetical protein NDAI_0K01630 [Naumovozyma dairenensis CBS 421]
MEEKLLNDDRFKEIQKLNAPHTKRRSIVLGATNELSSSDASITSSETEQTGITDQNVNILDTKLADYDNNKTNNKGEYKNKNKNKDEVDEDSITNTGTVDAQTVPMAVLSPAMSAQSNLDENMFMSHVHVLHDKEKTRYKRGTETFISYFDDVAFEPRPSILDGSVNEPYQLNFQGPTLEKIMKDYEMQQRKLIRQGKLNPDDIITLDTSKAITNFSGIYVAGWMAIALTAFRVLVDYYLDHDNSFRDSSILKFMTTDIVTVAMVDLTMYLCTYFNFFIQYCCKRRWIKWKRVGWTITSIYEFWFVLFFMNATEKILKLHWIAKIFLFLHSLVLLMKMHSFAFYNGYLWFIYDELKYSKKALAKIKDENEKNQNQDIIKTLKKSSSFCQYELNAQTNDENLKFPKNINLSNYFMYTMFPALVYQIEYPRTKKIRWRYVTEKVFAIFGTICLMIIDAEVFMYPIAVKGLEVRDSGMPFVDKFGVWLKLFIDLIPSFIVMYLLTFFLIWEAILNCIAELTRFGDRYFYGDWWNCVSWGDFSRIWNVPVHKFLVRHVYHSSMSSLKLNKMQATMMTFFISSVVHELSMFVIFKRLRFYLFFFQMLQVPLMMISESKYFKERTIIGNVIFWIGICVGPSMMCTLYLVF